MDLEIIIFSEISQTQKIIYCMFSFYVKTQNINKLRNKEKYYKEGKGDVIGIWRRSKNFKYIYMSSVIYVPVPPNECKYHVLQQYTHKNVR